MPAHAALFQAEFAATVITLADPGEELLEYLLRHADAVILDANPLLAGPGVFAPGDFDLEALFLPLVFKKPGFDPPPIARPTGFFLLADQLQPPLAQLDGIERVLQQLADAQARIAVELFTHQELHDL